MASGLRAPVFIIILLIYLAAGALYAILTPNWQAPDEPAHYNYVRYLATQASFPELVSSCYDQAYLEHLKSRRFPPELSIDQVCYEFHQPPLYYLLATPVFILGHGSLLALRLFSVGLGGGVVALAWAIGRTIFPESEAISYGTMAFVAFVPMHVSILASVNNDALAELIVATLLLLLSRRLLSNHELARSHNLLLGGLLGLGFITKMTVYIAAPLIAVTLFIEETGRRGSEAVKQPGHSHSWLPFIKQAALIYGLALVIGLPWYLRNGFLYGNFDILGLIRHEQVVVGQLRTVDFLTEVGWATYLNTFITTTFHSFWGQFGWLAVPMDRRTYLALSLLTLIALGGLLMWIGEGRVWKKYSSASSVPASLDLSRGQRQALGLMGLTIGSMIVAYGGYNLTFVQFQGRYLFPALIPLALFFSLGLNQAFARGRVWWPAGGLGLGLAWVIVTTGLAGNLDKRAMLLAGLPLALAVSRAWLARYWLMPATWLLIACYGGLSFLALISPFWFVLPYLSP